MLALGESAPQFELMGTDSNRYSLSSFSDSKVLVVVFSCNHCPYVVAYEERMVAIQREYSGKGVQLVAINSNDEKSYPEDGFVQMVKRARDRAFNFPYLRDDAQRVADAFGAVCTPHVFAFDERRKLAYRGRIDDSKDPSRVKHHDLRDALDDMVQGRPVKTPDTLPFGCSIKWYVK